MLAMSSTMETDALCQDRRQNLIIFGSQPPHESLCEKFEVLLNMCKGHVTAFISTTNLEFQTTSIFALFHLVEIFQVTPFDVGCRPPENRIL